jgi:hypothetical protein
VPRNFSSAKALYLGMKRLTNHGFVRICRNTALLCGMGAAAALAVKAPVLLAQDQAQRVVLGKVVDKEGAGVKGATVYLKDGHTLSVKSYVASDDGTYRFGQLAPNADYQLWAEAEGKKSGVKNISSFDTRTQFNITLKIEK